MRRQLAAGLAIGLVVAGILAGCSGKSSDTSSVSVFDVQPGQCFNAPKDVKSELAKLTKVNCGKPHNQESYAIVSYVAPTGASNSVYPGDDTLTNFAKGNCAQQFTGYVGVDYLDSSLWYTYLLPSARGWEQDDDRKIICFVTTTGAQLTASVKGSKK